MRPPRRAILIVPDVRGDEVRDKFEIQKCIEWTSDGSRCFLMMRPKAHPFDVSKSVSGHKYRAALLDPDPLTGRCVYAPLADPKWITPPKSALQKGAADLPDPSTRLSRALYLCQGSTPDAVDSVFATELARG